MTAADGDTEGATKSRLTEKGREEGAAKDGC